MKPWTIMLLTMVTGLSISLLVMALFVSDAGDETVAAVSGWIVIMSLIAAAGLIRVIRQPTHPSARYISITYLFLSGFLLISVAGVLLTTLALAYVFFAALSFLSAWLASAGSQGHQERTG